MRFPDMKDSVWVTKKYQSRPSGRTRGKESGDIGKSEFLRSKETRDRKSRNPDTIETVHLRGRVAGDWCHRRKARQEVVHQLIGNRDIGDPRHKGFLHFEITIREIPMSGVQLSAQ